MNNLAQLGDGPILGLWVDDIRPLPSDLIGPQFDNPISGAHWWAVATTFHDAIVVLEQYPNIKYVSLDHDIASFYGQREMTGYDILLWLAQRKQDGFAVPIEYAVHSANPVGKANMQAIIDCYFSADSQ